MLSFARSWLGVCLLLFLAAVRAQVPVPELSHRVTDLTGTLSVEQVNALESKLAAFEAEKGSQIAVLIVPTTQPEDIEQFGIRVADAWKIGREKVDDGVILIVAKDDRKLRLEVGYGLEGAIPDAVAKRVIAEVITPYFKAGDFAGGIDAGVTQLMRLIEGESLPAPPSKETRSRSDDGSFMFILIGGIIIGSVLSALFGRVMGGMLAGFGSGAIASLLLGFGVAALIVALMVFFIVSIRSRGGGGWSNGGGFGGGGGGGSSWGGGGGRFGGGGASGSW